MDVGKEVVMAKRTVVILGMAGCKVVATKGCGGHRETVAAVGRVGCRMGGRREGMVDTKRSWCARGGL